MDGNAFLIVVWPVGVTETGLYDALARDLMMSMTLACSLTPSLRVFILTAVGQSLGA